MKCPNCGAELLPDVRICLECGCDIAPQAERVCPSCGNTLSEKANYCSKCGTRVSVIDASSKSQRNAHSVSDTAPVVIRNGPSPEEYELEDDDTEDDDFEDDEFEDVDIEDNDARVVSRNEYAERADRWRSEESAPQKPWKKYVLIGIAVLVFLSFVSRLSDKNQSGRSSVGGQSSNSANNNRNTAVTTEARTFEFYIDLHSDDNLFFSTYDMDVFLDGVEIGTVADGQYFSKLVDVSKGKHTLSICKSGDHSLNAEKVLTIKGPTTFSATISHTSTSISFNNSKVTDNVDGSRIVMIDTVGMILSDAESQLKTAGFANVSAHGDKSIWEPKNWIVITQNIEAGTTTDKNDLITLECIKIDQFFDNMFSGKTLSEAQTIASERGLTLSYLNDATSTNITDTINALSEEEKAYWKIEKVYADSNNQPRLYLRRIPKNNEIATPVSASGCKGKTYTEVMELFRNAGFINVTGQSYYDEIRDLEEEEVNQVTIDGKDNFYRGEVFDIDAPIVIMYFLEEDDNDNQQETQSTNKPTVLTKENNADLAALCSSQYVDPEKQQAFVKKYEGKTIELDCFVYMLFMNERYQTIYSYILAPGDGTDEDNIGAALFYLENMSMFDFKWDNDTRPAYLTVGSKIKIRAKVTTGEDSLYIYLDPVKTWGR